MLALRGLAIQSIAVFASLWIVVVSGAAADAATPPRIALVIGNGDYENAPLANPVNDARLIAQTLRQLDFQVLEHLNVNQKDMKRAIQLFGDRLELAGAEAVGLFYYAGHGVAVKGRNYLIPTDAAIDRESDVDIEAVATDTVLAQMEFTQNALNFVILDACRNNPYARSFRSATRGLARMDAPRGTLISYATAPGDVALDGDGEHSPYSRALAKAMLKPGMLVEQMFKRVRQLVVAETENRQTPWESSSLTGDFYFKAGASAAATGAAVSADVVAWNAIEDSTNAADIKGFIQAYPDSALIPIAQSRLKALAEPKLAALPAAKDSRGFDGKWTGDGKMTQGGGDCHTSLQLVLNIVGTKVRGTVNDDEGSVPLTGTIDEDGRLSATGWDDDLVADVIGTAHDTIISGTWKYRGEFCQGTFNVKKKAAK
jgi:carboxyl-terminal processing protease